MRGGCYLAFLTLFITGYCAWSTNVEQASIDLDVLLNSGNVSSISSVEFISFTPFVMSKSGVVLDEKIVSVGEIKYALKIKNAFTDNIIFSTTLKCTNSTTLVSSTYVKSSPVLNISNNNSTFEGESNSFDNDSSSSSMKSTFTTSVSLIAEEEIIFSIIYPFTFTNDNYLTFYNNPPKFNLNIGASLK